MKRKNLVLHFNFIKKTLQEDNISFDILAERMKEEFAVSKRYVYEEVRELKDLGKIKEVKHNNETLLLWTNKEFKFEYELSANIVELEKQYCEFVTIPSKVRQMRLPKYVLGGIQNKIADLNEKMELMLQINAIKCNGVWYKIQKR